MACSKCGKPDASCKYWADGKCWRCRTRPCIDCGKEHTQWTPRCPACRYHYDKVQRETENELVGDGEPFCSRCRQYDPGCKYAPDGDCKKCRTKKQPCIECGRNAAALNSLCSVCAKYDRPPWYQFLINETYGGK